MKEPEYDLEDNICALATPWGRGALAIIRTSGPECIGLLTTIFHPASGLEKASGNTLVHGYIHDTQKSRTLDEVMLAVYKAPKSYTGQDSVEIMCHGSLPGIRCIMDLLRANGFRDAGSGEFTMRAFLNGKLDLTQAEAVQEIICSKTRAAHHMAYSRLKGSIYERIDEQKKQLVSFMARIELELDYPEDEIDFDAALDTGILDRVISSIDSLLESYRTGKVYRDGIRIALAGQTNAGKSSLFNLFVKEDRAIVSEIHGTTRDYLSELLTIRGIPVTLVDTAGLRESVDSIEIQGINRSRELIRSADIVLYVCDASQSFDPLSWEQVLAVNSRCIGVWNKIDLNPEQVPEGFVAVSALSGEGFSGLEDRIYDTVFSEKDAMSFPVVIDSDRQRDLLHKAMAALEQVREGLGQGQALDAVAVDMHEAISLLGEITGEVSSADILEKMFSDFCVGK